MVSLFDGCKMLQFREEKHCWRFNKLKDEQLPCDNPPEIVQVGSSVFSDNDNVYSTGRMVRIDIQKHLVNRISSAAPYGSLLPPRVMIQAFNL
ncbi:MAG: hypothetical protein SWO11_02635 [Thermodesulfobacteriota bacterium]|nr:hypothetical protein [Thermodesulfobacteriota bacterium]